MRRFGFRDYWSVGGELRLGHEALADAVTEAMTVNETSFFRDAAKFARLRDKCCRTCWRRAQREKRLRIWSAGCASGQEVWSLAIMLDGMPLEAGRWT